MHTPRSHTHIHAVAGNILFYSIHRPAGVDKWGGQFLLLFRHTKSSEW
jgi:hypothetical protein